MYCDLILTTVTEKQVIVDKAFDGNDRIMVFYMGLPDIKITPTMTMAGTSESTATQLH